MGGFDTKSGYVELDNGVSFGPALSLTQLNAKKLSFARRLPLPSGVILLSTEPETFVNRLTWFTFWVENDCVKRVSLGFQNLLDNDPLAQQKSYSTFLGEQLGSPSEVRFDGAVVVYRYAWGGIDAAYDPRNGTSTITVAWN